ncbi:MAG TPA: GAF domain-containing protein [Streptosporangiaceae bacterium]|jgi:signal transduction histidine kinase|nr:GAF domain-containing protein [Streptosporangiaceae bacterium]
MSTAKPQSGLPSLRLDELLAELQTRLQAVLTTRDRVNALFDAVVAVGTNLDIEVVLRGIVEAAVTLVDARYGAMGVIGEGGRLAEFIPVGLSEDEIGRIHHWPEGRGLLGALIADPTPIRIGELAEHELSSGFPAGHPPMNSFLGAPIRIRDEVYGNLYLTEKRDGGEFDEEDEAVLVALAAAAGVAIENARLYDEARRQQRWLGASGEVTRTLLSGADASDALVLITARSLEMSGSDLVVLALPTADKSMLRIEHAAGDGAEEALGLMLPAGGSASGQVLASGQLLALDDFSHDDRVAPLARQLINLGPAILVPLGQPGNVRGVLTAGRRPGAMPLTPAAAAMLETFASQAGIALELAEHRRQAERVAVFEDRDRIARDLHDLVIQRLYATGMSLQGAVSLISVPDVAQRVSVAVDSLDETIREIRSSIFALQTRHEAKPPGLRTRILQVADELTDLLGFPPALQLAGRLDDDVPSDVGEHLLGALRETLSNVARHSGASRVEVQVRAAEDLTLIVRDNGSGIKDTGRRSGLRNLEERAEKFAGTLTLRPADGGGTEVEWRVPLPAPG